MERDLLVVEGADCMGKSTLIEDLRVWVGWEVFHTGGPKGSESALELSFRMVEGLERPAILDRVPFLSEIAYRPINQEGEEVPEDQQAAFIERFARLDPVVIFCRRRVLPDVVVEERPHKPVQYWNRVRQGYPGIVDRYDKLIEQVSWHCPVYVYDWAAPYEPEGLLKFLRNQKVL